MSPDDLTSLLASSGITPLLDSEVIRPLKRVEYEALAAQGFFAGERVELIFGQVIPRGSESIRPLRRVEYEALAKLGFLEDEKVELLFGAMVPMAPADDAHAYAISEVMRALVVALNDRATVYCQAPFAASEVSLPEPDIFVFPKLASWPTERPAHAQLVIEVSRSSLRRDRHTKAKIYASADVSEYWIVNHVDGVIEVHRDRQPDGTWKTLEVFQRGDVVHPLAYPDVGIAVDAVVPPPRFVTNT